MIIEALAQHHENLDFSPMQYLGITIISGGSTGFKKTTEVNSDFL